MKRKLTMERLLKEASEFALVESMHPEPSLFGVTDGKAIGTYLEQKFRATLELKYQFTQGNSALGIDFPELDLDIKVTSIRQPQSSCPFKSARQKIYGLGYALLIFVYQKTDNRRSRTGTLKVLHTIHVSQERTADFQMTKEIRRILENDGNADDLIAYMRDRNLPIDEIEGVKLAEELLRNKPEQGYLTVSNALQWRLQYSRVLTVAGEVPGVQRIR